jgi:hypothetical protein
MASIYDSDMVRLPSIHVPEWQKHKLDSWLRVYNWNYSDFIREIIFELRVSFGTATPNLVNPRRDCKEAVGRVIDTIIDRAGLEGKIESKTPEFVIKGQKGSRQYGKR